MTKRDLKNKINKRRNFYNRKKLLLEKKLRNTYNMRLVLFLAAIILLATASFYNNNIIYLISIIPIVYFLYFIFKSSNIKNKLSYINAFEKLNSDYIYRLENNFKLQENLGYKDISIKWIDEEHSYAHDLDILGENSLYTKLNFCTTLKGMENLKDKLLNPLEDKEVIKERQKTIEELRNKYIFSNKFLVEGMIEKTKKTYRSEENIIDWIENNESKSKFKLEDSILLKIIPIANILSILFLILYLMNLISLAIIPLFSGIIISISTIIFYKGFSLRSEILDSMYDYQISINKYLNKISLINRHGFDSKELNNLKEVLEKKNGITAYEELINLKQIASKTINRNNMAFIPINIILLWDYQMINKLKKWKAKNKSEFRNWLIVLSEFEALISLSKGDLLNIDYVKPNLYDSNEIKANNIKHPLIMNAKGNDFTINKDNPVTLITGSNMSGKSTFLRTIGINLVLAYNGLRVNAEKFDIGIFKIYTCMRVSDNIEKNISSFYGEILRIKNIVEATKRKENVFFLLDEIFKGTNSIDRHHGAEVLIKQLYQNQAIGIVSTHDLELTKLEKDNELNLKNYYFQEEYINEEINFDYKLREGVSNTRNGKYLMKLAGIKIK